MEVDLDNVYPDLESVGGGDEFDLDLDNPDVVEILRDFWRKFFKKHPIWYNGSLWPTDQIKIGSQEKFQNGRLKYPRWLPIKKNV